MLQHIYFELKNNDRLETEKNVTLLNQYLQKLGIKAEMEEQQGTLETHIYLGFKFDSENVERKITRDAGTHKKMVSHKKSDAYITVGQIKEMQKNMTNEQIIEALDISRATFYRRLKEHKNKETRTDESF